MFSPEEALFLTDQIAKVKRKREDNAKGRTRSNDTEYYPNYDLMVEYLERVKVHSEDVGFPNRLFTFRYPNQTDAEFEYQKNTFKRVTRPVYIDYINTVGRAFIESNFSIDYQEDESEFITSGMTLEKYLTEDFPKYGSIVNWARNSLPSIKATDANGVIAIRPNGVPKVEIDGELVQDTSKLVEPQVHYYPINRLVGWAQDAYAVVELSEKSEVLYGNRRERSGLIYEFYDDTSIYRVVQVGKKVDWNFEISLFYQHDWGKVPVTKTMGLINSDEGELVYSSQFMAATDCLDQVLLDESNLSISKAKDVFPTRIMIGDPCDFVGTGVNERCNNGTVRYIDGDSNKEVSRVCNQCNGTGLKHRLSPQGVLLIKPPSRENTGNKGDADITDPIKYVSPDITTLSFLREETKYGEDRARSMLHLSAARGSATGSEDVSATQKLLDAKSLASFVMPISNQTWQIIEFSIRAIGWMRYKDKFKAPTIIPPQEFDFKTPQDYLGEIKDLVESGSPPMLIHNVLRKLLKSMFYTDAKEGLIADVIMESDRLLTMKQEDIQLGTNVTIEKWESILHDSSTTLIQDLIRDDERYLDLPRSEQIEKLKDAAKQRAKEIADNNQSSIVEGLIE